MTTVPDPNDEYEKPVQEQILRADLEETWQAESPSTARNTSFADEVDGRLGTRHRKRGDRNRDDSE
ncbi:MAG: hypothetical protein ACTHW3_06510 [Leucobacter sp.]